MNQHTWWDLIHPRHSEFHIVSYVLCLICIFFYAIGRLFLAGSSPSGSSLCVTRTGARDDPMNLCGASITFIYTQYIMCVVYTNYYSVRLWFDTIIIHYEYYSKKKTWWHNVVEEHGRGNPHISWSIPQYVLNIYMTLYSGGNQELTELNSNYSCGVVGASSNETEVQLKSCVRTGFPMRSKTHVVSTFAVGNDLIWTRLKLKPVQTKNQAVPTPDLFGFSQTERNQGAWFVLEIRSTRSLRRMWWL